MRAGGLDRTVSFESPVAQQDSVFGSSSPVTWQRIITCRARKQDMRPSRTDSAVAGAIIGRNQTTFYLRWRPDITGDMRLIEHGDTDVVYSIVGGPAEVGGRKRELEIVCERYTS